VLLLAIGVGAFVWASVRLKPMLRERLITAIREQYQREIKVKDIGITLFPRFAAIIEGLAIDQKKDRPGLPPLIVVNRVAVTATLRGMLSQPLRVERVVLEGLQITVPPKRRSVDKPIVLVKGPSGTFQRTLPAESYEIRP
jgi:hypothetical protein